ncbi:MAG: UDP-galactopyranose mutase [Parasutterella excrementihominis]
MALQFLAEYVYEKIFLHYTEKQWDVRPEDLDPLVTGRVPVFVGRDNRYFQAKYQGIPLEGYTRMFEKMVDHPNIEVRLNTEFDKSMLDEYDHCFFWRSMNSSTISLVSYPTEACASIS